MNIDYQNEDNGTPIPDYVFLIVAIIAIAITYP